MNILVGRERFEVDATSTEDSISRLKKLKIGVGLKLKKKKLWVSKKMINK